MKMPLDRTAVGLLALVLSAGGCQSEAGDRPGPVPGGEATASTADASCPTPRHATHFRVTCREGVRVVETFGEITSFRSRNEVEAVSDVVVLVPRGEAIPPFVSELDDAHVIRVPVESYAVNNDDIMGLTMDLGLADRMRAVGGRSMYDDGIRARVEAGELAELGYSWHLPPDLAVLLERAPEATFLAMDSPHNVPGLGRSREMGLQVAPTFVWAERTVLARAEWLLFFSMFFAIEEEAQARFDAIEERYQALRDRAAAVPEQPTAMWGYYGGSGVWFVMTNNLESGLLEDAGARNIFANDGELRADGERFTGERLLVEGAGAEHWIIGDIHQADLPAGDYLDSFVAWREDRLYHNYLRTKWELNGYDWYEGATGRPDELLADLIHLIHPDLLPDHELKFMGRFDREAGR